MDMLPLPGGSYQLGTATPTPGIDVNPPRTYEVRPLRLARLDVTFDQYDSFAQATGRALPDDAGFGRGDHPVINVTGEDIEAFIGWLNSATGLASGCPRKSNGSTRPGPELRVRILGRCATR